MDNSDTQHQIRLIDDWMEQAREEWKKEMLALVETLKQQTRLWGRAVARQIVIQGISKK